MGRDNAEGRWGTVDNTLYLVVPCYNEEEVLRDTAGKLGAKMKALAASGRISGESRVVFVDDGSRDRTWAIIEELGGADALFAGVKLSRNRGHQHALLAGLMTARGEADMYISLDADLQDDIEAIDAMVGEFLGGCDIVYGVRKSRSKDTFFKRATAEGFYWMLKKLGCDIVFNHADYRLMSARALDALSEYGEQSPYLRGIVPQIGYRTATVEYDRGAREAGESKYPLKRMLSLAFDGLLSLSLKPLRIVTATGALMLLAAFALLVYSLVTVFMGQSMLDWKIVTVSVWAVGGIATLSIGIVGEYVGRAFAETKRRPRYFVERTRGLAQPQGGGRDSEG